MPGRRMLRDMMSVNDIYSYADPIIEMLREEYGSYDADTLDEVQVDERFAQRLQARGYEVRIGGDAPTPAPTPVPVPTPIPTIVPSETPVVPVTVVRARRTTPGPTGSPTSGPTSGPTSSPTGGASRARRTTSPGDGTRPATRSETGRPSAGSARNAPESSGDTAPSAEAAAPSSETERPTRTRRTTRTRSTGSNNGEATS